MVCLRHYFVYVSVGDEKTDPVGAFFSDSLKCTLV